MVDHFQIEEFARKAFRDHKGVFHPSKPYPAEWVPTRLPPLKRILEAVRHRAGDHPATILCGYRDDEYNTYLRERGLQGERKVTGVAKDSRHMYGDAVDFMIYGMTVHVLHSLILEMWEQGELPELGGVGLYERLGFIHIDTHKADDGHLRRWEG